MGLVFPHPGYAAGDTDSPIGEFRGAGCPKGDLSCVPTTTSDKISVSRTGDATLSVAITIKFDRGHSCSLQEPGTWEKGRLSVRAEGVSPDKPCILNLRRDGRFLYLDDLEQRCRSLYCGTRGTLEGTRFERK